MAKNIEPELLKIGDYLRLDKNATFVIPEYQRPYSWTISNCDKLWQDIVDFKDSKNDDNYFFGTIIINCLSDDKELLLIDGQQRTTTFLLLLKALLTGINKCLTEKFKTMDDCSGSLYRGLRDLRKKIMAILYKAGKDDVTDRPSDEDKKFYGHDIILTNNSLNENYKNELKNILQSADFDTAEKNAEKIKYKQKDNKYTNYFRNYKFFWEKVETLDSNDLREIGKTILADREERGCEVIRIKSWDVEQAIKMFNSLNSDGLPLCDSDIISAQLYGESKKQGKEDDFKKLREEYNGLVEDLKSLSIANDNSLLMQYMYYIRVLNGETKSDSGAINVTTPGLRRYFIEENKEPISDPIKMCKDLIYLAKVWSVLSEHTLVKILLKFNENSKLFLASYLFRSQTADGEIADGAITEDVEEKFTKKLTKELTNILECMLRLFAILEIVDAGYSSKYFKSFLFEEQTKLVDSKISCNEIISDFHKHISCNWKKDDIKILLKDYRGNALVWLNEYLFAKKKNISFSLYSEYDIEHIMPQSGKNIVTIRNDAGISDADEFKEVVNKLGNKIVLEQKINRNLGNEWFRTKLSKSTEKETGYKDSKYPIALSLFNTYKDEENPLWTKDKIESATDKARDRIADFIFE